MATEVKRVALIGAPGSGKSELAEVLRHPRKNHGPFGVVDDYVMRLESSTGLAFGYLADFVPNLMVATLRLACEFDAAKHGSFIVCGTAIETAAYVSLKAVQQMEATGGAAISRVTATMDALTMIMMDNWYYEHVFYLPLPQDHQDEWDKRLDFSIRDALATLRIDHTPLTDEDRLERVLEVLGVKD